MRVLDIFYVRFFTQDGERISIGGIETYIQNLIVLAKELDIGVRVFQFATRDFEKDYNNAIVFGIRREKKSNFKSLYDKALATRSTASSYINIIANDTLIPKWYVPDSIVIQHGIGFDGFELNNYPQIVGYLYRAYYSYRRIKRIQNVDDVVCVDNNYICWYRTQTPRRSVRLLPILNFTNVIDDGICEKTENIIKVVFARRFVSMRGTRLFAPVAKRILERYNNVEITFAGTGPDENYLKELFEDYDNVTFTTYNAEESVSFHKQFHIAVVPTIFSEGTSLSLLEAMSARCAVVCTNVGGMTNIILDEYNGLMISPNEEELFNAVSRLVDNKQLREKLSNRAYDTVKEAFSLEKWKHQWTNVINRKFNNLCLK